MKCFLSFYLVYMNYLPKIERKKKYKIVDLQLNAFIWIIAANAAEVMKDDIENRSWTEKNKSTKLFNRNLKSMCIEWVWKLKGFNRIHGYFREFFSYFVSFFTRNLFQFITKSITGKQLSLLAMSFYFFLSLFQGAFVRPNKTDFSTRFTYFDQNKKIGFWLSIDPLSCFDNGSIFIWNEVSFFYFCLKNHLTPNFIRIAIFSLFLSVMHWQQKQRKIRNSWVKR